MTQEPPLSVEIQPFQTRPDFFLEYVRSESLSLKSPLSERTTDQENLEAPSNGGPRISGLTYVNMVNIAKGIDDCQNVDKKDFSFHLFF